MIKILAVSIVLALATAPILLGVQIAFGLQNDAFKMFSILTGIVIYGGYTAPALEKAMEDKEAKLRRSRFAVVETPKED